MKRNILLLIAFVSILSVFGQSSKTKWTGSIDQQKAFIENKSQFDSKSKLAQGQILFGTDEGPSMIYFTKNGLTFRMQKIEKIAPKEENERERSAAKREEEEHQAKITTDVIHMQWENANPNTEVVAENALPNYSNYAVGKTSINHVKGYKKLIYKNLYPNIDVEYVYDLHEGIKYSLVLHPGADISVVKMKYTGNKKVSIDVSGNVHIATVFGDMIDHAPNKVYATSDNAPISSGFVKSGNTISFKMADYDHSKEVILDPWTTTPAMPTSNSVFYIKSDSVGNAYIYGGNNPFRLIKYNSAGTLQWTYNSPWGGTSWFGALAVDRAGNAYITEGSDAAISKISPAGGLIWTNTPTQGTLALEYWAMDFNCDQTQLFVGGTRDVPFSFSFYATVFQMNMTDGSITNYLNVEAPGLHIGGANEVRSMCSAPNANLYYLSLDSIGSLSQGLTNIYGKMSSYQFPYYMPYSNGGVGQGQNNIRATALYLYTTDGQTLHKRDITTGTILASATITGGSQYNNSGVAIDSCGNVYVGSQNTVAKYDANLNFLTSATTSAAVYDVSIGANGDVLACGNSFAVALAMSACNQVTPVCFLPFTATATAQNFCTSQCNGSVTANHINGSPPYQYLWSNTQTTQTISGLCAGTYTVTITDSTGTTVSASAIVVQDTLHATITTQPTTCGNGNGSATVTVTGGSSGIVYAWSNNATTQTISNVDSGSYSVTVTQTGGCSATATGVVQYLGGLALTTSSTNASCGSNNGSASVQVTGGSGNYVYTWSNGNHSATISNLLAGTFTITVTSGASCSATASVIVAQDTLQVMVTTLSTTCGNGNGSATANLSVSGSGIVYVWSNGASTQTISNVDSGSYSVTVTQTGGCSATATGVVPYSGGLSLTTGSISANCGNNTGSALVQVAGGNGNYTYTWSNGNHSATISNLLPGAYVVTVNDGGVSCSATASVMVGDTGSFTVSDTATAASCGLANGTATVQPNGGIAPYIYGWSNGGSTATINSLASGSYIITVTDSTNCRVTASVVVDSTGAPNITITQDKTGICPGDTAHLCAPQGFISYRWNEGDSVPCIAVTQPGNFWVTVSSGTNCTAVSNQLSVVLYPQPTVAVAVSGPELTASHGVSFQWYYNGASISGATSQTYEAQSPGLYMVIITDSNGCQASDTASYIKPAFVFPTAFTPNGDGKNDLFYPVIMGDVKVITLHIYNRWGQLIYDNAAEGWDGKFKGKEQPTGTYIYYAVVRMSDPTAPTGLTDVNKQGAFTLLR